MTTETEKSPREIARLFLDKWHIYASLLDAIELLIKGRDERAAKICDYYSEEDGDIASQAASAIRGKS